MQLQEVIYSWSSLITSSGLSCFLMFLVYRTTFFPCEIFDFLVACIIWTTELIIFSLYGQLVFQFYPAAYFFSSLFPCAAGVVLEEKNWPPFFPIIHHDVANEIPVHQQKIQYVALTTFLGMQAFTWIYGLMLLALN